MAGQDETKGGAAGAKAAVLVSIDDEHADDMAAIARRLGDAGMDVEHTMDLLGTVSGSIEPAKIDLVRAVEGVRHVEMARTYQLPPPESPIQ